MQPPASWISNIWQSELSYAPVYYTWRGLAPSPRRNYDTPSSRFTTCCKLSGYRYQDGGGFQGKRVWLIEWQCSLPGTVKVKTMKVYLAGINSYQLDLGIESKAFSDPDLERTIQGNKHDLQEHEWRIRSPRTRPHLLLILCHLSTTTYNNAAIMAPFTLAFAGFPRVGEFTHKEADRQPGPTFSKWFHTNRCVRIRARGAYMELTLPSSKTDPFRKGVMLTIAASLDIPCPVHAMKQFLPHDTYRPPYTPLFCIGIPGEQPFTREYVVHSLQRLAITAGLGDRAWNGHSFWRDTATWAAKV